MRSPSRPGVGRSTTHATPTASRVGQRIGLGAVLDLQIEADVPQADADDERQGRRTCTRTPTSAAWVVAVVAGTSVQSPEQSTRNWTSLYVTPTSTPPPSSVP